MNKYLVLTVLFTTSAMAQQPAEYQLKVTPAEVDVISDGLQTVPFGKAFPLINKLREQIVAQQPKPAPAVDNGNPDKGAGPVNPADVTCANPDNHCSVEPHK